VLEHADLLAAQMLDDLCRDRTRELLGIGLDGVAAGHQNLGGEALTGLHRLPVDQQLLALLDLVLLAAYLDDRVHPTVSTGKHPRDRGRSARIASRLDG